VAASRAEAVRAIAAASRVRRALNVAEDTPVDVFQAIGDLGLWLVFGDMHNMLGGLVRQGAGGVMISTARDVSVQRFTAAHELGHYFLHNNPAIWDDDDAISGRSQSPAESAAQLFAGAFVMPNRLMNLTLRRLGCPPGHPIDARITYLAARDMQVSYQAAVEQMHNLDLITRTERAGLLRVRPLTVKTMLLGGIRPLDGRGHVFTPSIDDIIAIVSRPGDEILLPFPAGTHVQLNSGDVVEQVTNASIPILRCVSPGRWRGHATMGAQTVELNGEVLRSPADVNSKLFTSLSP
jgi:hypothetical protein